MLIQVHIRIIYTIHMAYLTHIRSHVSHYVLETHTIRNDLTLWYLAPFYSIQKLAPKRSISSLLTFYFSIQLLLLLDSYSYNANICFCIVKLPSFSVQTQFWNLIWQDCSRNFSKLKKSRWVHHHRNRSLANRPTTVIRHFTLLFGSSTRAGREAGLDGNVSAEVNEFCKGLISWNL